MKIKDIPGFPGYKIDTNGVVYSYRIRGKLNRNTTKYHILKPKKGKRKGSYMSVGLSKNSKVYNCLIHILVLETFVCKRPKGMEARHFPDDDKTNNKLENLRWGTKKQNYKDRIYHGTSTEGSKNGQSLLAERDVENILLLLREKNKTQREIATLYNVSSKTISAINTGKLWKSVKRIK